MKMFAARPLVSILLIVASLTWLAAADSNLESNTEVMGSFLEVASGGTCLVVSASNTCCGLMKCPFPDGVCCSSGASCCPAGTICLPQVAPNIPQRCGTNTAPLLNRAPCQCPPAPAPCGCNGVVAPAPVVHQYVEPDSIETCPPEGCQKFIDPEIVNRPLNQPAAPAMQKFFSPIYAQGGGNPQIVPKGTPIATPPAPIAPGTPGNPAAVTAPVANVIPLPAQFPAQAPPTPIAAAVSSSSPATIAGSAPAPAPAPASAAAPAAAPASASAQVASADPDHLRLQFTQQQQTQDQTTVHLITVLRKQFDEIKRQREAEKAIEDMHLKAAQTYEQHIRQEEGMKNSNQKGLLEKMVGKMATEAAHFDKRSVQEIKSSNEQIRESNRVMQNLLEKLTATDVAAQVLGSGTTSSPATNIASLLELHADLTTDLHDVLRSKIEQASRNSNTTATPPPVQPGTSNNTAPSTTTTSSTTNTTASNTNSTSTSTNNNTTNNTPTTANNGTTNSTSTTPSSNGTSVVLNPALKQHVSDIINLVKGHESNTKGRKKNRNDLVSIINGASYRDPHAEALDSALVNVLANAPNIDRGDPDQIQASIKQLLAALGLIPSGTVLATVQGKNGNITQLINGTNTSIVAQNGTILVNGTLVQPFPSHPQSFRAKHNTAMTMIRQLKNTVQGLRSRLSVLTYQMTQQRLAQERRHVQREQHHNHLLSVALSTEASVKSGPLVQTLNEAITRLQQLEQAQAKTNDIVILCQQGKCGNTYETEKELTDLRHSVQVASERARRAEQELDYHRQKGALDAQEAKTRMEQIRADTERLVMQKVALETKLKQDQLEAGNQLKINAIRSEMAAQQAEHLLQLKLTQQAHDALLHQLSNSTHSA